MTEPSSHHRNLTPGGHMRFQLLGPLEVIDDGRPLAVNGSKQRAALGFLLLHVNSVVATSTLLKALWPVEMPTTGRKMLQNAVSGLRQLLSPSGYSSDSTVLLTHAPGYLLRAPSDSVDLNRFHDKVNDGRAKLADGDWPRAASTLRDALALWRGPVLADLVELGVDWPVLTTVRNSRLAAIEDYVEAEFACGRYGEVMRELETWVEAEPLRERLCGQLMRALYHNGRQADALGVYRRIRTRMIDSLGLDPGRELQELEQAILNQELVIEHPRPVSPSEPRRPVEITPRPAKRREPSGQIAELKWVSVVVVMTRFGRDVRNAGPEHVDAELQHVAATIREETEQLGGIIGGTIGPLWLALFGPLRCREDDAARAVRAALAIRDRLLRPAGRAGTLTVAVAVATGDALVRRHQGDAGEPPMVTGAVLDRCLRLLTQVPDDEVRVCAETRTASDSEIAYATAGSHDEGSPAVTVLPRQSHARSTAPFVGRDRELGMLLGALNQVGTRSRPHLVTVLGEPGIGKSRLIAEFHHSTSARARFVTGRSSRFETPGTLAALADCVRSYSGISDADTAERADRKLTETVTKLAGDGTRSAWLLSHLRTLLGLGTDAEISRESFPAWRQFLDAASGEEPLVLVVEDLHLAEDLLLDFIDHLTGNAGLFPILVVVTARTELLDRRPTWAGGKAGATTITLDPLSDEDITRLLAILHDGRSTGRALRSYVSHIGGNPLFAGAFARMLRENTAEDAGNPGPPVPQLVHRTVASRLDSLPTGTKAVLVDAAVIRSGIRAAGVSAVGGQAEDEVSGALEHLERHGLLTRVRTREPGVTTYEFRHKLIRDIAYLTIPQAVRADKHQRAATWVELQPGRDALLLAYHRSKSLAATHVPAQRGAEMIPHASVGS
ncbi:BTAD domain-containing putative transcriptional regulator [Amycolatopsis alba]|uniref:Transcriptional activator n=1 Tax=Amycolatopsis sp. CP2808 TaxID=411144 RepID=A0A649UQ79_9PSEU|nr:BTAD domain-containing putative transcriptional regulator [Amycolatopsis alba]QGJ79655.1 Transcriptional activator [Amycolatopsis sp. CP2808]